MKAPSNYIPAIRSQDLPAIDTTTPKNKPKTLAAKVMLPGHGLTTIQHAGRGYNMAFIEAGLESRWWFKRGGSSPELFADLIAKADAKGRRWRIVEVVSGEFKAEG